KSTREWGQAPVGQTIADSGKEGEEVADTEAQPAPSEPADAGSGGEQDEPADAAASEPVEETARVESSKPEASASAPAEAHSNGGRIKASPLARRVARERGIELSSLTGTGPDGRIVAEDVERGEAAKPAAPAAAPSGEIESVPLTKI